MIMLRLFIELSDFQLIGWADFNAVLVWSHDRLETEATEGMDQWLSSTVMLVIGW